MSILSVVLGLVFILFRQSFTGFHTLNTRQSVQGEVLRIRNWFSADFGSSHYGSVGLDPSRPQVTVEGRTYHRDSICCLTMSDWNDDSRITEIGLPMWDRYVLYYSNLDDSGELQRILVRPSELDDPGVDQLSVRPFPDMGDLGTFSSPEIKDRRTVAHNLLEFECIPLPAEEAVEQHVTFYQKGGKGSEGAKRVSESFEAIFRWTPRNTVPRL